MTEREVVAAFVRWLEAHGWTVKTSNHAADIDAQHPEHGRLLAEAKGLTKSAETAADIGYGQLLRDISNFPSARYAYVAPEGKPLQKALRISTAVRELLGIGLYAVSADGTVRHIDGPPVSATP